MPSVPPPPAGGASLSLSSSSLLDGGPVAIFDGFQGFSGVAGRLSVGDAQKCAMCARGLSV